MKIGKHQWSEERKEGFELGRGWKDRAEKGLSGGINTKDLFQKLCKVCMCIYECEHM